jgi:excisionase family DNA binding protein
MSQAKLCYTQQHLATLSNIQLQNINLMSSNLRIEKTCIFCNNKFIAKKTTTEICSLKCSSAYYKKRKRDEKITKAIEADNKKSPFNPVVKEKEFLSVKETCMLLGASRWTIYRLIDSGKIKAAKLGTRTLIQRADINNLFNLTV